MDVTTIDILRHGKTEGGDIFRGDTDVLLSELGWQQMQQVSEQFKQGDVFPWQHIISSPLKRCALFSQQLSQQQGGRETIALCIEKDLKEISFGDWDGQLIRDVRANDPDVWAQYARDPSRFTPPNGEPMADFQQRVKSVWEDVQHRYQGQHVLLVCHGGVFRILLGLLLQMPLSAVVRFDVPYACFSRIKIYHSEGHAPWPQLVFHSYGAESSEVSQWLGKQPDSEHR